MRYWCLGMDDTIQGKTNKALSANVPLGLVISGRIHWPIVTEEPESFDPP